jgi:hypothetical protein
MNLKWIVFAVITSSIMFCEVTQARNAIGSVNLGGYCNSIGFSQAGLLSGVTGYRAAFDNWVCSNSTQNQKINMDKACRWQYPAYRDVVAWPLDPHDAYSWKCYQDL